MKIERGYVCLLESILFVGSHETKLSSTYRFPTGFDPCFDLSDLYPVSIDLLKSIPIKFLSPSFTLASHTEKKKGATTHEKLLGLMIQFRNPPRIRRRRYEDPLFLRFEDIFAGLFYGCDDYGTVIIWWGSDERWRS